MEDFISAAQRGVREADYAVLARSLVGALRPANRVMTALITADLGLQNGTPQVLVRVGAGGGRRAVYALPVPVRVGRLCFVVRTDPSPTGSLLVVASNYQVDPSLYAGATDTYLTDDDGARLADGDGAEVVEG